MHRQGKARIRQSPLRRAGPPAVVAAVALAVGACSPGHATPGGTTSPNLGAAQFTVTTTLDGLTSLPHRIHWQAFPRPSANVTEVEFLIDGKQYWVEHRMPYYYGDDGNYLVTTFLAPGPHAFTVRAVDVSGHVATDAVTASVPAAPRPPAALAGTWKRYARQSSAGCTSNSGQPVPCPPAGYWRLVISPIGWQVYDTAGGGGLYDVVYLRHGLAEIRTGMATGHPNTDGNAWCNMGAGDRPAGRPPDLVRWSVHGNLLSFTPVGSQKGSCGFTAFLRSGNGHRAVPWTKAVS
jgi:hypothetical protein